MIKSDLGNGKIHSGVTPLLLTVSVRQTAPMQLVATMGKYVSTGESKIVNVSAVHPDAGEFLDQNLPLVLDATTGMIKTADGRFAAARRWDRDENGNPKKPIELVFRDDLVFDLTADTTYFKWYRMELGFNSVLNEPVVLLTSKLENGIQDYGYPDGYTIIQQLLFDFQVPPNCVNLDVVSIASLSVHAGLPPENITEEAGLVLDKNGNVVRQGSVL